MKKFSIFRYDPYKDNKPYVCEYEIPSVEGWTVLSALNSIYENMDHSLDYDHSCRSSLCGSCAMLINGIPMLACRTLLADMPDKIILRPLPYFKILKDLSVDTGIFFKAVDVEKHLWIHSASEKDYSKTEERYSDEEMTEVYELNRCIECGCCIAACATANMNADFLGAAGLVKIARFIIDPRDERTQTDWYEVIGTEDGIFGCTGLLACNDYCPKKIPIQKTLAFIRRKMTLTGLLK